MHEHTHILSHSFTHRHTTHAYTVTHRHTPSHAPSHTRARTHWAVDLYEASAETATSSEVRAREEATPVRDDVGRIGDAHRAGEVDIDLERFGITAQVGLVVVNSCFMWCAWVCGCVGVWVWVWVCGSF